MGIGNTHGSGFWCHPGEGAKGHGGLRLTEALHHADAGFLVELVKDGWVQGLTGSGAVFERTEIIFTQVLAYHETVDSRRCAEARHLVFLHLTKEGVGIKLLMVEYEHGGTSEPLTIELTPYGLAPAGIGYGQVERTLMEVMPEHTCGEMAHGIQIVVGYHLGLTAGTRGKVHQHGVVVGIHESGAHELRCLLPLALPVVESLRNGLAMIGDSDVLLHGGAFRHGGLNLAHHIWVVHTDNGLHRGTGIAIYDVMLCQHVGGRNYDGAYLAEGEHHDPPFIAALQNQHHGVVFADAQCLQITGSLISLLFQFSVGGTDLFALIVSPEDGQLLRCLLSPRIHHVVGEIEVLRNDEFQVFVVILNRRKLRLL